MEPDVGNSSSGGRRERLEPLRVLEERKDGDVDLSRSSSISSRDPNGSTTMMERF